MDYIGAAGGGLIGVLTTPMSNFFSSVIYFLTAIWEFLSNILNGLLRFYNLITSTLSVPVQLLDGMWEPLALCIGFILIVGLVKLIVGVGNI